MKHKVVFFVNSLYGGGAEKVLQTLLRFLDRQKFEITLYSLHPEKLNESYPVDITYRHIYGYGQWGDYFKTLIYQFFSPSVFYRLFVKGKYDTEVAFIEGYSTRIVSGSTNPGSKKIAWVHCNMLVDRWTYIAYRNEQEEENCYNRFDYVVAVSQTSRDCFQKKFPNITSATCLYNPIDSEEIIKKSKEL